ncbi:MAG: hypothetical protein WDN47_02205 [Candidatus Doudnabacteria bacterium]
MAKCMSFGGINLKGGGMRCPNCKTKYPNKEDWQKANCPAGNKPKANASTINWPESIEPLWGS